MIRAYKAITGAPANKGFQPTPLCGEQDRGDFGSWIPPKSSTDLSVRRG